MISLARSSVVSTSSPPRSVGANLWLAAASVACVLGFVAWLQFAPVSFGINGYEDGPIEYLTSMLFMVSSIGFAVAARRSQYLKAKGSIWAYSMVLAWSALMFLFFAEEISWGQRIIGFGTPEDLRAANVQKEFNIHNLEAISYALGGHHRFLSMMILLTGLVFPLVALTAWGRKLFQRLSFPVSPLALAPLFVGAYLFVKYFVEVQPFADHMLHNAVTETRELLLAIGMAAFGVVGAIAPNAIFRVTGAHAAAVRPAAQDLVFEALVADVRSHRRSAARAAQEKALAALAAADRAEAAMALPTRNRAKARERERSNA